MTMFSLVARCFGMLVRLLAGRRSLLLVGLEALPHHRHTRNRSPLAPDWLSNVLAADLRIRRQLGRNRHRRKLRELIFRMVVENVNWAVPRIHGGTAERCHG